MDRFTTNHQPETKMAAEASAALIEPKSPSVTLRRLTDSLTGWLRVWLVFMSVKYGRFDQLLALSLVKDREFNFCGFFRFVFSISFSSIEKIEERRG